MFFLFIENINIWNEKGKYLQQHETIKHHLELNNLSKVYVSSSNERNQYSSPKKTLSDI